MLPNQDDKFWDLVQKRIEEEKCILIIGPDFTMNDEERPLNERLKEYLEGKQTDKISNRDPYA